MYISAKGWEKFAADGRSEEEREGRVLCIVPDINVGLD
jgi:hypothetical protein